VKEDIDMSKLFFDSHDSFSDSRTDHSLGSLPDAEIFDLLDEFYAVKDAGSPELDPFEKNAPALSQEEARLCDMIIDRMEAGGLNPQAAMLLVSMYACSVEERVMRSEMNKYVCEGCQRVSEHAPGRNGNACVRSR
jgi:hypothetical protein